MTITITATYYASTQDMASAQQAVGVWNNQSGNFTHETANGNVFIVNFDLQVSEVATNSSMNSFEIEAARNIAFDADESGGANIYTAIPDQNMPKNSNGDIRNGTTTDGNKVYVKNSRKTTETGAHEVGHSLGLVHGGSSLMSTSSSGRSNNNVRTNDIKDMINYPLRNRTNSQNGGVAGKGTIKYTPSSAEYDHHTIYYNKKNKVR